MRPWIGSALIGALFLTGAPAASGAGEAHDTDQACPPGMPHAEYQDVPPGHTHEAAIECLTARRIAQGTSPGYFTPAGPVTRAQMATFLARTMVNAYLEFDPATVDHFADDDGSAHEEAINQLAEAGIALGDADGRFRPHELVTRGQMASFLHRTHDEPAGLPLASGDDHFPDDDGSPHEASIDAIAEAGIAVGAADGRFDPSALVRRDQMASFLARFLDVLLDRREAQRDGPGLVPPLPGTDAVAHQLDPAHTGSAGVTQAPSAAPTHAWTADLGGEPSYPLIVGDTVFVVARGKYETPYSGAALYALDADTGAERWRAEVSPHHGWAAHTYAAGRVFTVDAGGGVTAFDAGSGSVQWVRDLPEGNVVSPPTAYGDALFVAAGAEILALDAATGDTRWDARLPGTVTAPAVTDQAVFVSTGCHDTYAFTRDGSEGGLLFEPAGAELLWRHEPTCWDSSWQSLVVHDGRVYSRTPSEGNLVLDAATGAEVGTHPSHHAPAFLDGMAFATDARSAVIGFDAETGALRWRKRAEHRFAASPIVASGAVYAATQAGALYAFDPGTGDALWAKLVGHRVLVQYELETSRPPAGLGVGRGLLAVPTTGGLVVFRAPS